MNPPAGRQAFDPSEDERLVAKCLAGDGRAWEALVVRYERLVYAVARGYRLSDEDLGDVFQEVFAALVRGLPRLREPHTLCRWLSSTTERIARATALKSRRERARTESAEDALDTPDPGAEVPGSSLEVLEEQALVRIALSRLAERCRSLLGILYYEDPAPSYAELAVRLGIPVGSIGPTRARCIDRLRAILVEMGDPGGTETRITPAPGPTSTAEGDDRPTPRTRQGGRVRGTGGSSPVQEAG